MPGPKAPHDERRDGILRAAYRVAVRERLGGLTTRGVAAEAGVSQGLVFFYFANREGLLTALLDWLLETTIVGPQVEGGARVPPTGRLLEALARDVEALPAPAQRARVQLLLDYWVAGLRSPAVREKIRAALDGYRDAYRPLAAAAIAGDPDRFAGVTADGLAAVVAGYVEGCALQAVMDPERFDVGAYLATLRALVLHPEGAA